MKNKNMPRRMGNVRFLILWAMGYAFTWISAWFGGMALSDLLIRLDINILSPLFWLGLAAGGVGLFLSTVQIVLVERGLKQRMRGWLPASMAGWALSALWLNLLITSNVTILSGLSITQSLTVFFASFLLPPALTQFFWLRRQVKSAWLWVIAALASAALFALPFTWTSNFTGDRFLLPMFVLGMAGLLHALVSGATMRHLWNQPLEKGKHDKAKSTLSDAEYSHLELQEDDDIDDENDDLVVENDRMRRR
jgi:lysylphosphatidylglycerol synthetase-like protein (DUF2156 family)